MEQNRLLFGTLNSGKLVEAQEVFQSSPYHVLGAREWASQNSSLNNPPQVAETGDTYFENAKLKADAYFNWSGLPCFADDAGLEVDALDGAPGLYSARYAGAEFGPEHIQKVLSELENSRVRSARFRSLIYCVGIGAEPIVCEGVLEGIITEHERGDGGFGYDSIFQVAGERETLAEIKASGRTIPTHRIKALQGLLGQLKQRV